MPGSVANTAPDAGDVMPFSLCKGFQHSRMIEIIENEYPNGESQREKLAETSRLSWQLTKRLTAAEIAELRGFYDDHDGPHKPFYFYDVFETSPKFSYDETGVETVGRYIVRFASPWRQSIDMGRGNCELSLIQIT